MHIIYKICINLYLYLYCICIRLADLNVLSVLNTWATCPHGCVGSSGSM